MASVLAEKIVHVPEQYNSTDKSTAVLLKEAGLPARTEPPTTQEIEDALRADPDMADAWLRRGGDQRYAGGWGIEQARDGYHIQDFAHGGRGEVETSRMRAVAQFISRYIGFISDVLKRLR